MATESVNIAVDIDTQRITDALRVLDEKEEEERRAFNAVQIARAHLDAVTKETSHEFACVLNSRKRPLTKL